MLKEPTSLQVAFDATPLEVAANDVSGHQLRGIGRYVASLLSAFGEAEPEWTARHLRPVCTSRAGYRGPGVPLLTRRIGWRRQDVDWATSWLFDRAAVRGTALSLWHAHDPGAPLSPLSAARTVVTAYDLIPLHEPAAMPRRAHRRLVYRRYLQSLREARHVVAISEVTAQDLQARLAITADRITVVYPAVTPPPPLIGELDGRRGQPPNLLFVGVPEPHKRPELALESLAECRRRGHDVRLLFCGHHTASRRADLEALAARLSVSDAVDYLDRVPDERLTALYRQSVLLALSRIEGLGLPAIEAVMAGGRVVCAEAPAYREAVGAEAEYAEPVAVKIADAYERQVSRLPSGPSATLLARFSPKQTAQSLIGAYEHASERGA